MKKIYFLFFLIVVVATILFFTKNQPIVEINQTEVLNNSAEILNNQSIEQKQLTILANNVFQFPLDRAMERITKKPFGLPAQAGIYITPQNSSVQPEKFTGYHTGVDFETFSEEQNIDVEVKAICDGSILFKNYVSGYGGALVQSCKFENQDITVIYGHLKISSVMVMVG